MKYLIRTRGLNNKAHIRNGEDTECKMFSSGGLKDEGYKAYPSSMGRSLCQMCMHNMMKNKGNYSKEEVRKIKLTIRGSVANLSNSIHRKTNNNKKLRKKKPKKSRQNFYMSKEWRRLRYKVLVKYGNQCMCCGRKPPDVAIHVDHIKPRSKYPELELDEENLQILCEDCNLGKSNKDDSDFRGDPIEEALDLQHLKKIRHLEES